jgi:hypothetical protein
MIGAALRKFEQCICSGCMFHMSQSLWRKWKALGLQPLTADAGDDGHSARETFRFELG